MIKAQGAFFFWEVVGGVIFLLSDTQPCTAQYQLLPLPLRMEAGYNPGVYSLAFAVLLYTAVA